jgi:hypothetical protein
MPAELERSLGLTHKTDPRVKCQTHLNLGHSNAKKPTEGLAFF